LVLYVISNESLGEEGILSMGDQLSTHTNLESLFLDIGYTDLDTEIYIQLVQKLAKLTKLKNLHIRYSGNEKIDETLSIEIAKTAANMKYLEDLSLWFYNCKLSMEVAEKIVESFLHLKVRKIKLYLGINGLSENEEE
jgi:hypothetical protein